MSREVKMTFGLTDKHIKAIEDIIEYWNNAYSTNEDKSTKAINQRHVWLSIGEKIGWEPLTALLYYLDHKEINKYNATDLWNNAAKLSVHECNGYWKALKDLQEKGVIKLDKIKE